ncbi:hydroxyphenylacetyl-CoA thioesterase PaaI [Nocardioides korecus]
MSEPDELARRSVEAMWADDAASAMLGMVVSAYGPGSGVVEMTVRPDMVNGWGTCHGGLIATLADSAFAVACNSRGTLTVGAGFDITILEPGRLGDRLVATARERALRGRSGVYDVTVHRAPEPGAEREPVVVAEFRGRSRSLGRPIAGLDRS